MHDRFLIDEFQDLVGFDLDRIKRPFHPAVTRQGRPGQLERATFELDPGWPAVRSPAAVSEHHHVCDGGISAANQADRSAILPLE